MSGNSNDEQKKEEERIREALKKEAEKTKVDEEKGLKKIRDKIRRKTGNGKR